MSFSRPVISGEADEPEQAPYQVTRGSDPSEIISRLEIRYEYFDLPDDSHLNSAILRADYAPTEYLLLRTEIPVVAAKSKEFGSDFGLADIILGARGKAQISKSFSMIFGSDFIVNTATDDSLGTGRNQFVPYLVGVLKPDNKSIFGLSYWHFGSFGGDSEREEINESLIRPQALYNFPYGTWIMIDPKIYINHEKNDDTSLFLDGEIGKVFGNIEVWIRGGGNVAGTGREEREGWKAEAGFRYLWH